MLLRTLRAWGRPVRAVLVADRDQEDLLRGWDIPFEKDDGLGQDSGPLDTVFRAASVIVDGILGTGIRGAPRDRLTISPREALRWATIAGARALMMSDRIGSIAPGKQADLVLLRADDVTLFPVNDPVQTVVLFAGPGNVDTVMIAGRKVKQGGRLAYPAAPLAEKRQALAASVRRIFADGGYRHRAV